MHESFPYISRLTSTHAYHSHSFSSPALFGLHINEMKFTSIKFIFPCLLALAYHVQILLTQKLHTIYKIHMRLTYVLNFDAHCH
jgi:hypothetical protein